MISFQTLTGKTKLNNYLMEKRFSEQKFDDTLRKEV